jgi:hypothetical protein
MIKPINGFVIGCDDCSMTSLDFGADPKTSEREALNTASRLGFIQYEDHHTCPNCFEGDSEDSNEETSELPENPNNPAWEWRTDDQLSKDFQKVKDHER